MRKTPEALQAELDIARDEIARLEKRLRDKVVLQNGDVVAGFQFAELAAIRSGLHKDSREVLFAKHAELRHQIQNLIDNPNYMQSEYPHEVWTGYVSDDRLMALLPDWEPPHVYVGGFP